MQKVKVVLVATDEAPDGTLILFDYVSGKVNQKNWLSFIRTDKQQGKSWSSQGYLLDNYRPQHLYFSTSNEEIKQGDWYIVLATNELKQAPSDKSDYMKDYCKKVVATTNPELWFHDYKRPELLKEESVQDFMPTIARIDEDFLKLYVRKYNEGPEHRIEYVMLEDEEYDAENLILGQPNSFCKANPQQRLKLKPNGACIIHPVKDKTITLTREIAEQIWTAALRNAYDKINSTDFETYWNTIKEAL